MQKAPAHSWMILALILLTIGGGAYVYSNPDLFQGRFSGKGTFTSSTIATIEPKGGTLSTQTVQLSSLDFDAADDVDNPLDAFDQRWITVGYWDVKMNKDYAFCNWEGANSISIVQNDGTSSVKAGFLSLSDNSRLVLRNKTGKTITSIENVSGNFYPTVEIKDDFQIQFDIHMEETADSYIGDSFGVYLSNLCLYNSKGQMTYTSADTGSQNKYFTRKNELSGIGLQGGVLKIAE